MSKCGLPEVDCACAWALVGLGWALVGLRGSGTPGWWCRRGCRTAARRGGDCTWALVGRGWALVGLRGVGVAPGVVWVVGECGCEWR